MTQPPDQPIGIPGAQPQGPSLQKPIFQAPVPPAPTQPLPGPGAALVLAGWGVRWAAVLIDASIRWVITFALAIGFFVLFAEDPFSTEVYDSEGISNLGGIFLSALFLYHLVLLFYAAPFMAMWNGATPGKRMVGIRVVTEQGIAPTFGQAVLRESIFKTIVVGWVGGSFFLPYLLNYLWPLWDDQSRAGHDYMARTRVVKA